jgi:competence protein ComEC
MPFSEFLRKAPFLRLLVFFGAGLLLPLNADQHNLPVVLISASILLLTVAIIALSCPSLKTTLLPGMLLMAAIFLAGLIGRYAVNRLHDNISSVPAEGIFMVTVNDLPETKPNSIKITGTVTAIRDMAPEFRKFRILLYFEKDSSAAALKPGARLCMHITPEKIAGPANPGEFDYSRYMGTRGIYLQAYVPSDRWHLLCRKHFGIRAAAMACRQRLLEKYSLISMNEDELATLSALTLGYRSELDDSVENIFIKAGVMHLMALSGFNVGVLVLFLGLMLAFLSGSVRGTRIRICIIIPVLWAFAFVTGLSPSVTRATVMACLVLAGRAFGRNIISFNILGASAFLMLLANPGMTGDAGFQLSFSAVAGIIAYQPLLYKIVKTRSLLLNGFWKFFTVTVAAQLATLPVSLYYFHQFPVYFWITNLYAIPLVSIIIYMSSFYLIFSFIKPLAWLSGRILAILVRLLLKSIAITDKMPFALADHIFISGAQVFVLFMLIMFMVLWFTGKKALFLKLSLMALSVMLLLGACYSARSRRQNLLVINNIKGATSINFISGNKNLIFADPDSLITPSAVSYSFRNFWIERRVCDTKASGIDMIRSADMPGLAVMDQGGGNIIFLYQGIRIARIKDPAVFDVTGNERLKTGILLISGKYYTDMDKVAELFAFDMLIVDSSVSGYYASKWAKACKERGIAFYNVNDGAYYVDMTKTGARVNLRAE